MEDGDYLLNKAKIVVEKDEVPTDQLKGYLRQTPNVDVLFFPKLSLHIYSLSGRDTTKKINRLLRRMGSAPVIYDEAMVEPSEKQLKKRMQNLGYLNAQVNHCCDTSYKKMNVTYCIRPNDRYFINDFKTDIESSEMNALLKSKQAKKALKLKDNEPFVSERFDNMSSELTKAFWNMGYYNLAKENFYFLVDTAVGNHKVDVTLKYRKVAKDSSDTDIALKRYKFGSVVVYNGVEKENASFYGKRGRTIAPVKKDTIEYKGMKIVNGKERLIRPSVLHDNIFIRPDRYYSDQLLDNTYNSLNSLSAVGQVGIQLEPTSEDSINAAITLTPANIYHFQFGIDGTNTAGDLGVASYVAFQQKNLFKGSEVLSLKLNGAYEHIRGSSYTMGDKIYTIKKGNYYEYGGDLSLTVPRIMLNILPKKSRKRIGASTIFSIGANWRKRPEYDRMVLGLDWKYNWYTNRKKVNHTFDLLNINYVVSPSTSEWFKDYLESTGNELLKESYKNHFITRSSYSIVYTSDLPNDYDRKKGWTIRAGVDVAGTFPYLICSLLPIEKQDGAYRIVNTPFAQYSKVTFDVSKTFFLKEKVQLVGHVGLGVAIPYGNSDVIPYEQRFFAGGANTVRGWSTRTLGPGAYDSRQGANFITQAGDVKFVANLEYRQQTNTFLDFAAFLDAGNVWTIENYEKQKGGQFGFNTFYKELGFSWGVGIRPNFKFILIRLDAGMQIYNPAYPESERWVITSPSWNKCALHFAVGYPF